MNKCKVISEGLLGAYECPNLVFEDGMCFMHSRRGPGLSEDGVNTFKLQFQEIFKLDNPEFVFQDIIFPKDLNINISKLSNKNLIFRTCQFHSDIILQNISALENLLFDDCRVNIPLIITECEVRKKLSVWNTDIHSRLELSNITGDFILEIKADILISLSLNDLMLNQGAQIFIGECRGPILNRNIEFRDLSLIRITSSQSENLFVNTKFLSRTDFIVGQFGGPPKRLVLQDCALDNLYCKNVDFDNDEMIVERPTIAQKPQHIIRNFKSFYPKKYGALRSYFSASDDPEYHGFIQYIRQAKDYFKQYSEHVELYDLYYRLDHFYSRLNPVYGIQNHIINDIYRIFSNYGYSVLRPIAFLFFILLAFNCIYLSCDYGMFCHVGKGFFKSFGDTWLHHLSQLSLYRSPDLWFPTDSPKRLLLIIETIIIIPILSWIIIGIRRVFRRA